MILRNANGVVAALTLLATVGCEGGRSPTAETSGVEVVQSALTNGYTKINVGAGAMSPFVSDVDSTGGSQKTRPNTIDLKGVSNPAPAAVYQSQRYGNFTYTLPGFAARTDNKIRLHFAETHWNASGLRRFNVSINGTNILMNFDVFVAAGAMNRAVIKEFVWPSDSAGKYVIKFSTIIDAAFVSGIEVLSTTGRSNAPPIGDSCLRPVHLTAPVGKVPNVMASATVIPVIWRAPGDLPTSRITDFSTVVGPSDYLKWIRGQYGFGPVDLSAAPVTIAPKETSKTLDSAKIAAELNYQITQKVLAPLDTTKTDGYIYMVYLPADTTVSDPSQGVMCVDFCGYHGTAPGPSAGHNLFFAVLPDLNLCTQNANGTSCKGSDFVARTQAFMSHELVETLTNPDKKTGWLDQQGSCGGGEIGDVCVGREGALFASGASPIQVNVQAMYSNTSNQCVINNAGAPLTLFGSGYSSLALAGNLSDNMGKPLTGIPAITTSGLLGAGTSTPSIYLDYRLFSVNDATFLDTYQRHGVPLWGDFDGDGLADMAVTGDPAWSTIPLAAGSNANTADSLRVTNAGITTANPPSTTPTLGAGAAFPSLIASSEWTPPPVVGDFNGDGRSDIAKVGIYDPAAPPPYHPLPTIPIAYGTGDAAGKGSGLWWATNGSDGGLNALYASSATRTPHVLAADFNRDGRTDLALVGGASEAGTPWDYIYVSTSNGDGTFASPQAKFVRIPATGGVSDWGKQAASDYYVQPVTGDFNGDGLTDVLLAGAQGTVWTELPIAYGRADGAFEYTKGITGGDNTALAAYANKSPMKVAAGDWDGDGRTDIVLVGPAADGNPRFGFSNGPGGTFKMITSITGSALDEFMSLAEQPAAILVAPAQDMYRQL